MKMIEVNPIVLQSEAYQEPISFLGIRDEDMTREELIKALRCVAKVNSDTHDYNNYLIGRIYR